MNEYKLGSFKFNWKFFKQKIPTHCFKWLHAWAEVQENIRFSLGPLFTLTYIGDLMNGLHLLNNLHWLKIWIHR